MPIQLRDKSQCQYDLISLGEIMLRLDPGEGRIRTARQFKVWEGGGEYNVARGLRRCFGLKTAVCTAFVDNDVGRLLEDFILQGGVGTEFIKWAPFDGVGRVTRNGLNFTERGFGVRGAVGVSDRGHTAASQLKPGDFDWDNIFGKIGVRWLHTGGIFAALSDTTPQLVIEAVKKAKQYGTIVSYDLNYRPSLWKTIGGQKRAQEVNREIAKYVDVMIGNEEDFTACLGFEVEGADENLLHIDVTAFKKMIEKAVKTYPNFKAAATTLRAVKTATDNDWAPSLDGRQILREPEISRPRNFRPRRRRRQLRERFDLRLDDVRRPAKSGGLRRGARRAGHDNARRHLDGRRQGSREIDERRRRPRAAVAVAACRQTAGFFIMRKLAAFCRKPLRKSSGRGLLRALFDFTAERSSALPHR